MKDTNRPPARRSRSAARAASSAWRHPSFRRSDGSGAGARLARQDQPEGIRVAAVGLDVDRPEVVPFRRVLPLRRGDLTAGHVEGIVPQCRVAQSDVLAELVS